MNNMIEYLKWRGDIEFEHSPMNEVDIALLTMFVVPDFSGIISSDKKRIVLSEAINRYFSRPGRSGNELGLIEPKNTIPMIQLMGESARFSAAELCGYVISINEEKTEQFGAVTVILHDGTRCIIFKPTDDTIIGWREDCMLAVSDCVPAQRDALRYLVKMAEDENSPIIVAGQSKGGNLAAYAAINAPSELKKRIVKVYNIDGPGFNCEPETIPGYNDVSEKIITLRSQHSTIGTLMNEPGKIITVVSSVAGPFAHDPFVWEVLGPGFVRDPNGQSPASIKFKKAMDKALGNMNKEERIEFINELFELLSAGGAETLSDLKTFSPQRLLTVRKLIKEDNELKEFMSTLIEGLIIPDIKEIRLPFLHS